MPFSLSPEQKQSTFWLALWLACALLLYVLGPILTPFIAAAILAYALNGAVDYLERVRLGKFHLPRSLAVVVVMLSFLGAVGALVLIVVPVLRTELPLLQAQIPDALARIDAILSPRLAQMGIHVKLDGGGLRRILTQQITTSGDEIWATVLASARVGGSALLGWLATTILIPVVLFYLLLDWHRLLLQLENAVPRRWVRQTVDMAHEVNALLAQYLRGQLLVMLVLALYYSAALALAGFEVALPVGILTGLLVFIPYLG